jgi:hypothetical protein
MKILLSILVTALPLLSPGVLDAQVIITPSSTTTTWNFNVDGTYSWEVMNTVTGPVMNGVQTFKSVSIGTDGVKQSFGTKPVDVLVWSSNKSVYIPPTPLSPVPLWVAQPTKGLVVPVFSKKLITTETAPLWTAPLWED